MILAGVCVNSGGGGGDYEFKDCRDDQGTLIRLKA